MKKIISIIFILILTLSGCANNTTISDSSIKAANKSKVVETKSAELNTATKAALDADPFKGYTLIEVDGGDLSGDRKPNVAVDIGFGDREYYAFTNKYGQLVKVTAKKITLQDKTKEPVLKTGRYYPDEAKVPGVEDKDLDEGHVIADSLGGVSNAYNITPQNSTLNRHGDQAYMEKVIRDANGCTDFTAIITYPNTKTQIPSHYSYTYTLKGNVINDEFDNIDPDKANKKLNTTNSAISSDKAANNLDTTNTAIKSDKKTLEIVSVDLNREEVVIKNNSDKTINLKGYILKSVKGDQKYTFPSYDLASKTEVTVYSGKGSGDLKWTSAYIWNNDGDPARLIDNKGNLIDEK